MYASRAADDPMGAQSPAVREEDMDHMGGPEFNHGSNTFSIIYMSLSSLTCIWYSIGRLPVESTSSRVCRL
jgi:hypothetical protein